MRFVSDLSLHEISTHLRSGLFNFHVGPYCYSVKSDLPQISEGLHALYTDVPLATANEFVDFRVAMNHSGLVSRLRGQADFLFDHHRPFGSIQAKQAYAFMEWGMNWCVSIHANEYLKLHAAAVAKNGTAIVMPGVPGAGKSTLCAALGLSGWRVLSDEHALIPPGTTNIVPLYRPVSLKNESISVIKSFSPDAVFGPVSEDTHKGEVAHVKADLEPDSHDKQPLKARTMLFPRYARGERQRLSSRPRTESFILAAYHSFNYSLLGEAGFQAMKTLIDGIECYDLVYHDLDWAIETVNDLHSRDASQ